MLYSRDLHDQLVNCPDTRFLAAYLFSKYCVLVTDEETLAESSSKVPHSSAPSGATVQNQKEDSSLPIVIKSS